MRRRLSGRLNIGWGVSGTSLLFSYLLLAACSNSGDESAPRKPSSASPESGEPVRGNSADRPASLPPSSTATSRGPRAISLGGQSSKIAVTHLGSGSRIYARHLRAWVHSQPSHQSPKLGYLRAGSSAPRGAKATSFTGCKGGWFKIEPDGFICRGAAATLEVADPTYQLFEQHPPRVGERLPYLYGTVRKPGPIYARLPTLNEVRESEADFDRRFPLWLDAPGEIGSQFRPDLWNWGAKGTSAKTAWTQQLSVNIPRLLRAGTNVAGPDRSPRPTSLILSRLAPRTGHAFLSTFFSEGRRYGLTTHLEIVPTDRYRPIAGSDFHGVQIGKDIEFPFAFVRRVGAKYSDGKPAAYRAVLSLTGKKKFIRKRLHYETKSGKYISDRFASELRLAKKMPRWAKRGEKWMSISINKQTLVLYEGIKPVYATLVSTGEAGLESHETSTATKRGIFRVHTKHITATMASDVVGEEFELRDVPYVQYFAQGGYALHGAYWHDRFGTPKSHGCINLSPEDARRIFHWTDPPVPAGWHGALLPLKGTVVFVHP